MHQIPTRLHQWVPRIVPNICTGNVHKKKSPNFTHAKLAATEA